MSYLRAAATVTPESDLVMEAAAGDAGAFTALYNRHVEAAWRLAQVTAGSKADAATATTNGFVRVVGLAGRGRDDVADQFRLHLLAAVYRHANAGSDRETATMGAKAPGTLPDAFAHLPARWRTAVWLEEVEGLAPTEVGSIMGITSAAALQLRKRGHAGLEHRLVQAGGTLPLPDLAPVLGPAAIAPPPALADRTRAKWKKSVARGGPTAVWVRERASGPLALCAAGLCVVGLVGLTLVGPKAAPARVAAPLPVATSATTTVPSAPVKGTGSGGAIVIPGTATPSGAAPTSPAAGASGTSNGGTNLIATTPATTTPPTTAPPLVATVTPVTPVTVPVVATTLPPTTAPPVTAHPLTTPAPAPIVQVSLNLGVVGVNLGVGANSCTGVSLLGIKVGCTKAPPGLTLGGSLLGQ